jgi:regulator of RNase E activity RraA
VEVGGLRVQPGDVVFADDDGVVIAPSSRIEAALETAEAIGRAERAILGSGASLHDQTNYAAHVERLDRGEETSLAFEPHE